MAVSRGSYRFKAGVLWYLKNNGNVYQHEGRVQTIIKEAVQGSLGMNASNAILAASFNELEDEGLIKRDRKVNFVVGMELLDMGDYPDPFDPANDDKFASARLTAQGRGRPTGSTSGAGLTRVNRIMSDIEKLPLPEKMMIVGQIADGCAEEVEETYSKLRGVLGSI